MKTHRSLIMSQQGVSAVEFALVLPFLLFLMFGIIEFGILLFDKAVITNASREGARAGIVHVHEPGTEEEEDDKIEAVVLGFGRHLLINMGTPEDQLTEEDIDIDRDAGDIIVTVTYNYDFFVLPDLTGLLGTGAFNGSINLVGQTIMRHEDAAEL